MFVFFEFFAPFFEKLWINRLNHRLPVPARIPKKSADRGASWWCARALSHPPRPPLYLRLYAAANCHSKQNSKQGRVNIYP